MDTSHQLIVRIRAFLNSTELINSPTSQELYKAYCELNNNVVKRLIECEVLLEKRQKIDAVVLVQQEPNLFDLVDALQFPERKDLVMLADLYDWPLPVKIKMDSLGHLKKAVSEMDDLRPLLTEYRRIARTDQVKNKLHLLREISRIDKGNSEWHFPLTEVENQYVSGLIAEAQGTIQRKDFARLEQIFAEFKNTDWSVTVPTIVLEKIENIVTNHQKEEAQKEAARILEKINTAYASFDVTALEDAVLCWQGHCQKTGYVPDKNEQSQFEEANKYLLSEKEKQKARQEFEVQLTELSDLMDSEAPISLIEQLFSKIQAKEMEIPAYLNNRLILYRENLEKERKVAVLIKVLKITGATAAVLAMITGSGVFGVQLFIENTQAKNLDAAIKNGKVQEAQSLLKEIEEKYPKLASRPRISQARAVLSDMANQEKERMEELNQLLDEIRELQKAWPPSNAMKEKLASAQALAKTELEKEHLQDLGRQIDNAFQRRADEVESLFYSKLTVLKQCRDQFFLFQKNHEYEQAEKQLAEMEKIRKEIESLCHDNQDTLKELVQENQELLDSIGKVKEILAEQKHSAQELKSAKKSTLESHDPMALKRAIEAYQKKIDKESTDFTLCKHVLKEIDYFMAIQEYRSGRITGIPSVYKNSAFFADEQAFAAYEEQCQEAREGLQAAIDRLQKYANKEELVYLRVKTGNSYIDIYAPIKGFSRVSSGGYTKITFMRNDGTPISMTGGRESFIMTVGDEEYLDCSLEYPTVFSVREMRNAHARHQVLIKRFFEEIHNSKNTAVFRTGIKFVQEVSRERRCAPYWKMTITLQILEHLMKADRMNSKQLILLKEELQELQKLDSSTIDPLYNKFMAEKIELFFKNCDFSILDQVLKQNQFLEKFLSAYQKIDLQYLGFVLHIDGKLQVAINPKLKDRSLEVLCFDKKTSGLQVVGHYDRNGLRINDKFQKQILGNLLFVSEPIGARKKLLDTLSRNTAGITTQTMIWPKFWPQNMRGESK